MGNRNSVTKAHTVFNPRYLGDATNRGQNSAEYELKTPQEEEKKFNHLPHVPKCHAVDSKEPRVIPLRKGNRRGAGWGKTGLLEIGVETKR